MSKPFLADVLVHNINCNYKQIYKHFVSRCEWVFKWVCAWCTVRGLKIRHCVLCVLWYFSAQHGSKEWLFYVIVTFLSAWTSIWLPLHFCWMFFVFCTIVKTLAAVKCENKKNQLFLKYSNHTAGAHTSMPMRPSEIFCHSDVWFEH